MKPHACVCWVLGIRYKIFLNPSNNFKRVMVAFYWILISDLQPEMLWRHITVNWGPSRFGDPLTRLSGPGPGQWVAKTHPYITLHLSCGSCWQDKIEQLCSFVIIISKLSQYRHAWVILCNVGCKNLERGRYISALSSYVHLAGRRCMFFTLVVL